MNVDQETRSRLRQAFTEADCELYRELRRLSAETGSDHLEYIFDRPRALDQKIRRSLYVAEVVRGPTSRVLDFGSGCGFLSCVLAATGAGCVVGVEINEPRRAVAQFLAESVFCRPNVTFQSSIQGLDTESFDAIIMANVISHVARLPSVIEGLKSLLRPFGLLFIEDNNNANSVFVRRRLRTRFWPGKNHDGEIVYARRRAVHIARLCPGMSQSMVDSLARTTYGLTIPEIERFIKRWQATGESPYSTDALLSRAPVDPETGQYQENAFRPSEIVSMLFNLGFAPLRSNAKHVFDYKENAWASWGFRTFPSLSLKLAPAFEVLACKK